MEEFRKFCAGITGSQEIITKIENLSFTDAAAKAYSGVNCLQAMAGDIEKLNA